VVIAYLSMAPITFVATAVPASVPRTVRVRSAETTAVAGCAVSWVVATSAPSRASCDSRGVTVVSVAQMWVRMMAQVAVILARFRFLDSQRSRAILPAIALAAPLRAMTEVVWSLRTR
jgi:hypothetical protein